MFSFNWIRSLFNPKKLNISNNTNENEIVLSEKEAILKCAQEIAGLGIWEWNYRLNKICFSDKLCKILDISKEKYEDDLDLFIEALTHNDYKDFVIKSIKNSIEDGIEKNEEYKIINLNGEEMWIRTNATCIYDDSKNKLKMIGMVQDITQSKKSKELLQENYNFLEVIIDTIPSPIFYKDEKGIYKYSNIAHIEYLGIRKEDIIGHTIYDIIQKEFADAHNDVDVDIIKNKEKNIYESKLRYKDGALHDVIFNKAPYTNQQGEVKGIVGVIVDITERKNAEKRINKLSKIKDAILEISYSITETSDITELFNLILEKVIESIQNAHIGSILILDEDENLKIATHKGYKQKNAENFSLRLKDSFIWHKTLGKIDKTVIINDFDKMVTSKCPNILENEECFKVKSSISSPIIIDGQLYGLIGIDSKYNYAFDEIDIELMEYMRNQIATAISTHKLYEETIYLSRYDKLTNVYNRRYFEKILDRYINNSIMNNEEFLLVLFDLNGLKFINDTYGHLAGDEIIRTFTSILKKRMNASDILARIGGDEFVGVFFETDLQHLIEKFEDIIDYFKRHCIIFEENDIVCSFSYGIAKFPYDGDKYNKLIKTADERMYKYKQKSKHILKRIY
ncbi:sensor domain-containing diguanylate cyclase [Tepidibacter aestuarii]|uniref:sensor domain-containing diguanylate cyclase n=1 Tax=Tepidibacter aestuarii TaxID=2925782 RepID=UPI0020C133C6|nr:diguanylate cyclase [Tepidibacter aestuarii]CAH2213417.1 PAS domain S-box-containing protein/diguanylate cyclase (GGDEF)-like protein [Tepidibacter aestuarii]